MSRAIIFVWLMVLIGCQDSNRYEMTKDANGRTVRLDKKTGEVAIVGDDRVTVLKGQKEQEAEAVIVSKMETPRTWPAIDIPTKGIRASLTTLWRDERLSYQFEVSPMSPQLEEGLKKFGDPGFTAILYDSNGFKVAEARLPLHGLQRVVNDKGESQGLAGNDSVPLTSAS